jgi:hypothetical protein
MGAFVQHVALVSESASVTFDQISTVSAALNKQVTRDFCPIWNVQATVDAFDKLESVPVDYWPVILQDDIQTPGAAGYHLDNHGQPFSLVQVEDNWSLTASHEALEMLADPFGSKTIAGSPPPQAPDPISGFDRVVYLVEVADPCEDAQYAYQSNGVLVSDFITPHYYDPGAASGIQYSFGGNIQEPHQVLEKGYVSFGNPVDNHWYQINVQDGQVNLVDLGVLDITTGTGKSLRELVDNQVRVARKDQRYRLKKFAKAAGAGASPVPAPAAKLARTSAARAKSLREYAKRLK